MRRCRHEWAAVTCVTGSQIGFMALGVGILVGFAVQYFGCGVDTHFGIVGAVLALVGCLAGNLLSAAYFLAVEVDVGYFDVVRELTPSFAYELLEATFSPIDLLFYAIAVYEGYRFAFRRVGEGELLQAAGFAAPVSAAAEAQATPPARPVEAASDEAQP